MFVLIIDFNVRADVSAEKTFPRRRSTVIGGVSFEKQQAAEHLLRGLFFYFLFTGIQIALW